MQNIARELIELLREANQEIPDWLTDVSNESSFGGGGYRGAGGGRSGGGGGRPAGRTAVKDVRSGGYGAAPPRMSQGAGFGGAPIGARPAPSAGGGGGWW